jgi:multiple sugar transport system permease protein
MSASRRLIGYYLRQILLVLISLLFLVPFYLIVRNAFLTDRDITAFNWTWLPIPPQIDNLPELFSDPSVPTLLGLRNSAIIAAVTLVFQMLFASMAGYGLARVRYRWSNLVFYLTLSTLLIPFAVTFIPEYVLVANLGWVNTLQGIIVPGLFSSFSTFMFRQFYLNFPVEIEEAGRVDGLGYFGLYRHVAIPNSGGVLIALGSLAFINSWNAFLWPLVIGQQSSSWTIQVVLSTFLTAQTVNLHELFMGAAVGIAPIVVLFFFLQRYLVEGVSRTGIKG